MAIESEVAGFYEIDRLQIITGLQLFELPGPLKGPELTLTHHSHPNPDQLQDPIPFASLNPYPREKLDKMVDHETISVFHLQHNLAGKQFTLCHVR